VLWITLINLGSLKKRGIVIILKKARDVKENGINRISAEVFRF